ncbi:MAG: hypothetical protein FWE03_07325 [Firmicutes bacterium]|nr:hypothetical protein [Bacillota bacterium]
MLDEKKQSNKHSYSAEEKRAYYIGQGIAIGQDKTASVRFAKSSAKVKASARAGYNKKKKK